MDTWIDFDCWAYLQLEMRGECSQERMAEVCENHKRAEQRKNEYQEETRNQMIKMEEGGSSDAEIVAYNRSKWEGLDKLVTAWRSLEGLKEKR